MHTGAARVRVKALPHEGEAVTSYGGEVAIAVVYIPPDLADDVYCGEQGRDYIIRKRYGFAGVYRSWGTVLQLVGEGLASLVIYARRVHWDPVHHHLPEQVRIEFADEETRRLPAMLPPPIPVGVRERRGRIGWGRERVAELVDGDSPAPQGLDPEALAAARRIAQHLANCRRFQ